MFGSGARFEIESVWDHGGELIFKFGGIDTISDAQPLVGSEVRIPFDQRLQLPPGEFFQSDLVGCEVWESGTGALLGCVSAWQDWGGHGVLVVNEDLMIPFVSSICVSIDPAAKRIVVDLPQGLKEVNQP